jgi:hypothetical protein
MSKYMNLQNVRKDLHLRIHCAFLKKNMEKGIFPLTPAIRSSPRMQTLEANMSTSLRFSTANGNDCSPFLY